MEPVNILVAVLLSVASLVLIMKGILKSTVRSVLIEEGIIRPLRPGSMDSHWPNGYRNLPDTLEGISNHLNDHLERNED